MSPNHICSWCHPGTPGNHGICEKHAREMLTDARALEVSFGRSESERVPICDECESPPVEALPKWWHDVERAGKRYDQVVFRAIMLMVVIGAALLIGSMAAVREMLR